jgi:YegS/Rv2252/BmrU family lipid kinase
MLHTRARVALARLNHPHIRRIAHTSARTGVLAARLLRWQRQLERFSTLARAMTRRRMLAILRVLFYVLPLAPLRRHALQRVRLTAVRPAKDTVTRARVIANPSSGTMLVPGALEELHEVVRWLNEQGLPTELCLTKHARHATQLAREAVKARMEMVIAAGGDGTINDVIQALAGQTTALGVLPLGTVNVWAHEMGIPRTAVGAADVLLQGERRRVDLGRAGSRYFLLMAGIGFDAEVARRVDQSPLKRMGLKVLDYAAVAGFLTVTQRPARLTIRQDGKRRTARSLMVIIGNTRLYGGAMTFTGRAVADDGLLDVVVVDGGGLLHRANVLGRAILRRDSLGTRVKYNRCRQLRLESDVPLPVQVDGEVLGTLPLTFSVAPLALTVIVPEGASPELFARDPLPQ